MTDTRYTQRHGLDVAEELAAFVEGHVLPGTGVDADRFWSGYAGLLAELNPEDLRELGELLAVGKLKAVIDRRYPLRDVPAAIAYLEEGRARGKVVIDVP